MTLIGNDQGVLWTGRFIFPVDRAGEVAEVMEVSMDDGRPVDAHVPPPNPRDNPPW